MRVVFTILLVLASAFPGIALGNDTIPNRIFNLIYNQRYDAASSLLQANKDNLDNFYFSVLEIDLNYWRYVTGTDQPKYDKFEKTLKKYNPSQTKTFNDKVIQLITLSYQLRYQLKRYKLLAAVSTRKQTKNVFNELKSQPIMLPHDQHELFLLYNSLFTYFDNYLNPFFLKNKRHNCKQAIKSIEKLVRSEKTQTKTVTIYFLGKIYLEYEKEPIKAKRCFLLLVESYPGNKKFRELLENCQIE